MTPSLPELLARVEKAREDRANIGTVTDVIADIAKTLRFHEEILIEILRALDHEGGR